jgi:hypothetical protein
MAKKVSSSFNLTDRQVADALEISLKELYDIVDFFDSDPDDEWQLVENIHFVWANRSRGNRNFSKEGAFAIAKYREEHTEFSWVERLVEFFTRHRARIRNALVQNKVMEVATKRHNLVYQGGHYYLSKAGTREILGTSYPHLKKTFEAEQRSQSPLRKGYHFEDIEGKRHYSKEGVQRLSRNLQNSLKSKDRRAWCEAVAIVGDKSLQKVIESEMSRRKRIDKAITLAKKQAKHTCQITGENSKKPYSEIKIAAHHLYSAADYPELADCIDNLFVIDERIHQRFHLWVGKGKCTVDDMIAFVNEFHTDLLSGVENAEDKRDDIFLHLRQVKNKFGHIDRRS